MIEVKKELSFQKIEELLLGAFPSLKRERAVLDHAVLFVDTHFNQYIEHTPHMMEVIDFINHDLKITYLEVFKDEKGSIGEGLEDVLHYRMINGCIIYCDYYGV